MGTGYCSHYSKCAKKMYFLLSFSFVGVGELEECLDNINIQKCYIRKNYIATYACGENKR